MNHYESAEHHQASADNMAKTALDPLECECCSATSQLGRP